MSDDSGNCIGKSDDVDASDDGFRPIIVTSAVDAHIPRIWLYLCGKAPRYGSVTSRINGITKVHQEWGLLTTNTFGGE